MTSIKVKKCTNFYKDDNNDAMCKFYKGCCWCYKHKYFTIQDCKGSNIITELVELIKN